MPHLDHMPEDVSPVGVTQAGLIRLNGPARSIALDVLRVSSLQTGAYVSHFRGRGMEFDESRPYQPGDDPRSIDWRVTARSTTAYTKLFREERELFTRMLGAEPYAGKVGVFEGAGYQSKGLYRPQADCIMFTRDEVGFCAVCRRAIKRVIDLYAR